MDPSVLAGASTAWALASALGVAALGGASLLGGRSRPPGGLAFGLFALAWGAQITVGQLFAFASGEAVVRLHLLFVAFLVPVPFLLLEFAAAHAPAGGRTRAWRAARAGAGGLALAAALALLARPALLYGGPRTYGGDVYPGWGPLFVPLVLAPFYLSFAAALVAVGAAARRAPTPRVADRLAAVVAGLGLFVAFAAGNNLAFYVADTLLVGANPQAAAYVALFLVLAAAAVALGVGALRRAVAVGPGPARRREALVAAALLAPLVWGAAEGLAAYAWLVRFETVGLWRLAGVAVLAYALARWRVPDLPERARRAAAAGLGVAAALAGGLAAWGAATLVAPDSGFPFLAAAAVPIAVAAPGVRLARRALRAPPARRGGASLGRRVDAYRAALESSLARGTLTEDEPFLQALRRRFRISDDVDEVLRHLALTTVVLPRERGPRHAYDRLRLLGEGAEGRSWLARHRATDRLVVLKEPLLGQDPARRATFLRRARLAARIRHPRVARVEEILDDAAAPAVVMEFVEGGSLADRLAAEGPFPPQEAVRAVDDVLDALAAVHAADLVHGDVKAENVLLDGEGRAKLADFGSARDGASADVTRTLGAGGSLSGLPPEQLDGRAPTPAGDLYAAGALLYRLLTGEHYVRLDGASEAEARARIRGDAPALPHPRVPAALEPVLRRALAKDPAERFPDARAMRRAL